MIDLKTILTRAVSAGASDIHLKTGVIPVIRRHGELYPLDPELPRLTADMLRELAYSILSQKQKDQLEALHEVDCGYGVAGVGRFRVNIFKQRGSIQMVFRAISDLVPKLHELNLPPVLERISSLERGLVLVTGVTGSGKSTTLAAMMDFINQHHKRHILTIEDPIEYLMRDRRSIVTQRELGQDTESFAKALRASLRQDPDVIMIGEMRDRETVEAAMHAAETGHMVFSTLHTSDATETINRILAIYEPHEQAQVRIQLAGVLAAIVSQRLAKRKDGKGIIPAVEIMLNTARTKDMILKQDKTRELIFAIEEGFKSYGMQSFDQSLMYLLSKDMVTIEEAISLSSHPEDFELRFRGIGGGDGGKWDNFDNIKGNTYWKDLPVIEVESVNPESEIVASNNSSPVKGGGGAIKYSSQPNQETENARKQHSNPPTSQPQGPSQSQAPANSTPESKSQSSGRSPQSTGTVMRPKPTEQSQKPAPNSQPPPTPVPAAGQSSTPVPQPNPNPAQQPAQPQKSNNLFSNPFGKKKSG